MNWISITDEEKPELYKEILLYGRDNYYGEGAFEFGFYGKNGFVADTDNDFTITHWTKIWKPS